MGWARGEIRHWIKPSVTKTRGKRRRKGEEEGGGGRGGAEMEDEINSSVPKGDELTSTLTGTDDERDRD